MKLQSRITRDRQKERQTDKQDMLRQNFSHGKTDRPIKNEHDHSHTLNILSISTT